MAISSVHHTIEAHLKTIPNRYDLARVVMLRTRQLIGGAEIKKGVDPTLLPKRHQPSSNSRAPKIALDEILLGEVKFIRREPVEKSEPTNDIVFSSI